MKNGGKSRIKSGGNRVSKPRKCVSCKETFTPRSGGVGQKVCSPECAYALVVEQKKKAQRKRDRQRLLDLQPLATFKQQAQVEFNKYIRARDRGKPCISCGITYGQVHAGHYRSRGAASHLAFNCWNCHAQCAQCNGAKSGAIVPYRQELVRRIGVERVEKLENSNETASFDRAYLERLRDIFRRRARHIERIRGAKKSASGY